MDGLPSRTSSNYRPLPAAPLVIPRRSKRLFNGQRYGVKSVAARRALPDRRLRYWLPTRTTPARIPHFGAPGGLGTGAALSVVPPPPPGPPARPKVPIKLIRGGFPT